MKLKNIFLILLFFSSFCLADETINSLFKELNRTKTLADQKADEIAQFFETNAANFVRLQKETQSSDVHTKAEARLELLGLRLKLKDLVLDLLVAEVNHCQIQVSFQQANLDRLLKNKNHNLDTAEFMRTELKRAEKRAEIATKALDKFCKTHQLFEEEVESEKSQPSKSGDAYNI